jgi:3-oxoadipate enol-lactonase
MASTSLSDLHYEVMGIPDAGRNPAIFIHDFITDKRLFNNVLTEQTSLLKSAICVRYDLRGFGKSPVPDRPYSRLDDLAAVHSCVGEAPAHVVGCGLGGTIALEYAIACPERVRSVTVVSSGLPGHSWQRGQNTFFVVPPVTENRVIDDNMRVAGLQLAREWAKQSPEWRHAIDKGGQGAALLRDMLDEYTGFHFWGDDPLDPDPCSGAPLSMRLAGVGAPVLVMVGEEEVDTDFGAIGREITNAVPSVAFHARQLHALKGAGHFGTLESPAECTELISEFWASLED